jgi:hypothetical protein
VNMSGNGDRKAQMTFHTCLRIKTYDWLRRQEKFRVLLQNSLIQ